MFLDFSGEAVVSSLALFGLAVIGGSAIAGTSYFMSTPQFQRSWQQTCSFIADATRNLDIVGIQSPATVKIAIKKLSELERREYKRNYERHHIVAQNALRASLARVILGYLKIDINGDENTVYIKTGLHRRLHTKEYYSWVNHVIVRAYFLSEPNYNDRRNNVSSALEEMKAILSNASKSAPY